MVIKKKHNPAVLQAAKKPREREINFKEFSRAPLDDYPEIAEPVIKEKEAPAPVANVENK